MDEYEKSRQMAACHGKVPHETKGAAMKAARNIEKRLRSRVRGRSVSRPTPTPFRCEFCGAWHVGQRRSGL